MNFILGLVNNAYAGVSAGKVDVSSWRPENFKGLVELGVSAMFVIGGIAFILLFIYGAIRYITSAGDVKAVDGAKKNITAAIVGVLIMASAYSVAWFLNKTLGAPTFGGIISWNGFSGGGGDDGGGGGPDDPSDPNPQCYTSRKAPGCPNQVACCADGSDDCRKLKVVKDYASNCVKSCKNPTGDQCGVNPSLPSSCGGRNSPIDWCCWQYAYSSFNDQQREIINKCGL